MLEFARMAWEELEEGCVIDSRKKSENVTPLDVLITYIITSLNIEVSPSDEMVILSTKGRPALI